MTGRRDYAIVLLLARLGLGSGEVVSLQFEAPAHSAQIQRLLAIPALWLGHESVETTQIYLDASLAMKEQALAKTTPLHGRTGRYQPSDQLTAFLNGL